MKKYVLLFSLVVSFSCTNDNDNNVNDQNYLLHKLSHFNLSEDLTNTISYNNLNKPISINNSTNVYHSTYTYDQNSHLEKIDQVINPEGGFSTLEFLAISANEAIGESMNYWGQGQPITQTWHSITYEFDGPLIKSIKKINSNSEQISLITFTHDSSGRLTQLYRVNAGGEVLVNVSSWDDNTKPSYYATFGGDIYFDELKFPKHYISTKNITTFTVTWNNNYSETMHQRYEYDSNGNTVSISLFVPETISTEAGEEIVYPAQEILLNTLEYIEAN